MMPKNQYRLIKLKRLVLMRPLFKTQGIRIMKAKPLRK